MSSYNKLWRRHNTLVLALADSSGSEGDSSQDAALSDESATLPRSPSPGTPESNAEECNSRPVTPSSTHESSASSDLEETQSSDSANSHSESSSDSDILSDFAESEGSSDHDTPTSGSTFLENLARWAVTHKVSHQGRRELLALLRAEGHDLPKDPRTLVKTPRNVYTIEKCNGQYKYFGIERSVIDCLSYNPCFVEQNDSIQLIANIDGIPIYKSSCDQFWPILIQFGNFRPLLVALYLGKAKPSSVDDYLEDFVAEYTVLHENGITINDKKLNVTLHCFACDLPARSFIKGVKGHAGYHSCERCTIKGVSTERRMTFPFTENPHPERTDDEFRLLEYSGTHQLRRSPLNDIGFPCIRGFSLDYMHLICLGVVRRMLTYLQSGPRCCRLSNQQLRRISDGLCQFSGKMPSEFARQPRSLDEIKYWKATEYRQFLLYTGAIVLKDVVSADIYEHFLTLSVAISILLDDCDERREHFLPFAQSLLNRFVSRCANIFGPTFTVHNVHTLTHLPSDASHFSCSLNKISCFPFENHLQILKKCVKTAKNPMAQVSKRLAERSHVALSNDFVLNCKHSLSISDQLKNSCFLLGDDYVFVKEKRRNSYFECEVVKQQNTRSFFKLRLNDGDFSSNILNIVFVKEHCRKRRQIINKRNLNRKVACLPYKNGFVLVPLLHGSE